MLQNKLDKLMHLKVGPFGAFLLFLLELLGRFFLGRASEDAEPPLAAALPAPFRAEPPLAFDALPPASTGFFAIPPAVVSAEGGDAEETIDAFSPAQVDGSPAAVADGVGAPAESPIVCV